MRFICIALFSLVGFFSQASYMEVGVLEDSLNVLLNGIGRASLDDEKFQFSDNIDALLRSELSNPKIFNHEFETVKKMAIISPEDGAFILFNWNIPLNNGANEFRCYLVQPEGTENVVREFERPKRQDKKLESRYLDLDKWYGCLYYKIIPVKKGKSTYYTLLGYSPEKKSATKKYIDILTIKNNVIRLGAPKFQTEKGIKKRVIFEFSSEVSMTIRWQEESDRIILDHLEPRSPQMKGNYQFYGPDGTFDAYILVKDNWEFQKGVDYRSTEKSDKIYRDPRFFRKKK